MTRRAAAKLPPHVQAEVNRILDAAAARLLREAREREKGERNG